MNKPNKFSVEVRERAVRMVREHRNAYPSQWAAIESIASKIGCTSQTLLGRVKRGEVESGEREGVTTLRISGKVESLNHSQTTSTQIRPHLSAT